MRVDRSVIVMLGLLWATTAWATTRTEAVDEDGDGRKETVYTYEGTQPIKAESDMNGDGKPDVVTLFRDGRRFSTEADRDFDGRVDTWITYDDKGRVKRIARDTNKDGKPDQYKEFVNGSRELVIEEKDTNFDGKIDTRRLMQWKADKTIPVFTNNRLTHIPNPGYVTLWREDDTNFDGRIDAYYERGRPVPSDRIGQDISKPVVIPEETKVAGRNPSDVSADKIKRLNELHGVG